MTEMTLTTRETETAAPADSPVLEIVDFRLIDGTDEAYFLEAAKGTEAMLRARGDLVRRVLVKGDDEVWTDVVEWTSHRAAMEAAEAVMTSETCQPFMALIDPESVAMRHSTVRWRME